MTYGVNSTGFRRKPLSVIVAEKQTKARDVFGSNVDLTESSPLKLFIEANAVAEAELWELLEDIYYAGFVDTAENVNLERTASLLNVSRRPAAFASGTVRFFGISGTLVPQLTVARTAAGIEFETQQTGYISNEFPFYLDRLSVAVLPGAAGNVGPGLVIGLLEPIAGITSLTNPSATAGGSDVETDLSLRQKIKGSLQRASVATLASLIANVQDLEGVKGVSGSENLVAHSAHLVVFGGAESAISGMISETKPVGIPVTWSRPTSINIYANVDVTHDGFVEDTTIVSAIVTYINGLNVGEDVKYADIVVLIMDIEGMQDVELTIGTTPNPTGKANITIDDDEVAYTSSSFITIL